MSARSYRHFVAPRALAWLGLLFPVYAGAEESYLAIRNHNPFLQIFGLPAFETAATARDGQMTFRVDFDIANHAEENSVAGESITLDGESYYLTMALRYGYSDTLVLGIDIPFVGHAGGFLDAPIENWHDLWGLSNAKRQGPRNQLEFRYDNSPLASYELVSGGFGVGDVRLNAAMALYRSEANGREAGIRAGVKLPTGDADELRGSGAVDYSLLLYGEDVGLFGATSISISGLAGVLVPGKGDVLPAIQKDTVAFAGVAATWQATERFGVSAGLYAQGAYFDSALDEIGDHSVQLAVGGHYQPRVHGLRLSIALVEDLFSDATTDFAMQFAVSGFLRGGAMKQ